MTTQTNSILLGEGQSGRIAHEPLLTTITGRAKVRASAMLGITPFQQCLYLEYEIMRHHEVFISS
jgi:hypothetical protein